jgi:glutamate-1-semialdehyde aminotransferase
LSGINGYCVGKPIGSGVPAGVYGFTEEVAQKFKQLTDVDDIDTGGIGGISNHYQIMCCAELKLRHFEWECTITCSNESDSGEGVDR